LNTDGAEVLEEWCVLCFSAGLSGLYKTRIGDSTSGVHCREIKWSGVHESFERQHDSLLENKPYATQETGIIRSTLIRIKELV
jgi:hypothetical protein